MGEILAITFALVLLGATIPPIILLSYKILGGYVDWLIEKFDI